MPPAPEWLGPPEHVLPSSFALEELLVRTDVLAIQVNGGRGFPNGFEFFFTICRRDNGPRRAHFDDPMRRWHEALFADGEIGDDVLRFGIQLADGRKATVFDRFRPWGDDRPEPQIVLQQRGGGGGGNNWEYRFWAWPLPPPGPVTFAVEWPSEGIPLTTREIDSEPIRAAGARATELWPGGGNPARGTSSITTMRFRATAETADEGSDPGQTPDTA